MISFALTLLSTMSPDLAALGRTELDPAAFICVLEGKPPLPRGPFQVALLVRTVEEAGGKLSISLEVADPGNVFDGEKIVNFTPRQAEKDLAFSFSSYNWPSRGVHLALKPDFKNTRKSSGLQRYAAIFEIETHDILMAGTCLSMTGDTATRMFEDVKKGVR